MEFYQVSCLITGLTEASRSLEGAYSSTDVYPREVGVVSQTWSERPSRPKGAGREVMVC
jgi:hypothetical protein